MDKEMIERCAKEVSKLLPGLEPNTMQSTIIALTIIKAMREPTDKMLKSVTNSDGFFKLKLSDPIQAWRAMVDAIIGDK